MRFFTHEEQVIEISVQALRIISLGYPFYAYGMVVIQSLNGAGDSKTPILLNILCFWLIEIPLAYVLAITFGWGALGVFISIPVAESLLALFATLYFKTGRWKKISL